MANENETTEQTTKGGTASEFLFGRLPIFTSVDGLDPKDPTAVVAEVNEALSIHMQNLFAMEYLYWYRRGVTPIYGKTKDVRPEINNKLSENLAASIVDFKNGYFLTQPANYVSRRKDEAVAKKVEELNEYLYRSGKHQADNELVDWFHTVGKADLFVKSVDDPDVPFVAYSLDPRSTFVVRSLNPGNEPVYAVYTVMDKGKLFLDVWTKSTYFKLEGTFGGRFVTPSPEYISTATVVVETRPNPLGEIPIIEYQYNSVGQSAFEAVIPLLDAINQVQSDRLDSLDQFVQSLLVFYNCELGDDESGNPITPSYVRAAGALFLKSIGENKADLKEISSELNQTQVQVFVDYLYQQVLAICGMPSTTKGGSSTSDTGLAVEMRDGWAMAETMARNTEDLFKRSNKSFDRIIAKLLKDKGVLDISLNDFELHFIRNEMHGVQSKAQALMALLQSGLAPTIALAKSGISADPVADYEASKPWMTMRWGDPNKADEAQQPQTEIVEEDNNNGDTDIGAE